MNDRLPKGFTCHCGHANTFNSYVFAHWRTILRGECDKCGRPVSVLCGFARPKGKRKGDPKGAVFFLPFTATARGGIAKLSPAEPASTKPRKKNRNE